MANSEYSIVMSGDTLINSIVYHKVNTPYVMSYSTGTCGSSASAGYKGAIRQEVSNRKVFIIPPSTAVEQLLYDFTLQVGDTVKGYIATSFVPPDIVQKIDSVLIVSTYRKRWAINPCFNSLFLIEGVGFNYGLLQRSPGCIIDESGFEVTCFRQDGTTLFPDTITSCDFLLTDVKNISSESISFSISPNPTTRVFSISTSEESKFSIYDVFGREVYQSTSQLANQSATVNLSSQPKGIYFVRIKANAKIFTRKIILE